MTKPKWNCEIPIEDFRLLCDRITGIRHKWEMIGADTSRNWVEIYIASTSKWVKLPERAMNFIQFNPDHHNSLFSFNHEGDRARKLIDEIDKWEQKHIVERIEYERLKRIFEP